MLRPQAQTDSRAPQGPRTGVGLALGQNMNSGQAPWQRFDFSEPWLPTTDVGKTGATDPIKPFTPIAMKLTNPCGFTGRARSDWRELAENA